MKAEQLRINPKRLMERLDTLAAIGATADGSCCRLALTDEDKAGRDLVVGGCASSGSKCASTRSETSSACAEARTASRPAPRS